MNELSMKDAGDKKQKMNEFNKFWETQMKLTESEDNILYELNQKINICFSSTVKNEFPISNTEENNLKNKEKITLLNKSLEYIEDSKEKLFQINKDIDYSLSKLSVILENRNTLTTTLNDFNNATKSKIAEEDKLSKLRRSIEKTLQYYDTHISIQALFENTNYEVVEKLRFTTDYEDIENAYHFFTVNSSYIENEKYLNTYKMLKRIALNRFHEYMTHYLQNQNNYNIEGVYDLESTFLSLIHENLPENMNIKAYNFPKNFETLKKLQIFFEKKAKDDYDVRETIENIKQTFIRQRKTLIKPFCDEIIRLIINSPLINNIERGMAEIFKLNICEILFFSHIFQTKISENISILQPLIHHNFEALYSSLRPIIVNCEKIDYLIGILDIISYQFNLFFEEFDENKEVYEITESIISKNLFKIKDFNETSVEHKFILTELIKCGRILIKPIITKIIFDVQEKLFFRVDQIIKNNFETLEDELTNIMEYEEKMYNKLKNFKICHEFLRKLSIVLELLNNKLENEVLNHLSVTALENFILLLNNKIISEKHISLSFEIFIIQQLILAIDILDNYKIEAVEGTFEVDFFSITEVFRQNIKNLFTKLNLKEIILNSVPKSSEKFRNFKNILYNNLLKSYKILITITNDYVFGRENMEIIYKVRNNETIDEEYLNSKESDESKFTEIYNNFSKIIEEIKLQIQIIDKNIAVTVSKMILENIEQSLLIFETEFSKKREKFATTLNIISSENTNKNLSSIMKNLLLN